MRNYSTRNYIYKRSTIFHYFHFYCKFYVNHLFWKSTFTKEHLFCSQLCLARAISSLYVVIESLNARIFFPNQNKSTKWPILVVLWRCWTVVTRSNFETLIAVFNGHLDRNGPLEWHNFIDKDEVEASLSECNETDWLNKEFLRQTIKNKLEEMLRNTELFGAVLRSYPSRLTEVRKNNEYSTKYWKFFFSCGRVVLEHTLMFLTENLQFSLSLYWSFTVSYLIFQW